MVLTQEYRVLDASRLEFDKLSGVLSKLKKDGWRVIDHAGRGLEQGNLNIILSRTRKFESKRAVA